MASIITDAGELRTTELTPAVSIRLLDRALPGKVDRYLDIVGSAREPDVRRMIISTDGEGERSLFVSYISETPIWKTTYRIVLSSKNPPLLQGWAVVDNTVGEDWDNVELSLVAGAPQSFIQNLSQPYYARRPIVPLPEAVNITPQTFESTLIPGGPRLMGSVTDPANAAVPNATVKVYDINGGYLGETRTDAAGNYGLNGVRTGPLRLEIEAPGFQRTIVNSSVASDAASARLDATLQLGSTAQSVTVTANAPTLQTQSSTISGGARTGSGAMLGSGAQVPLEIYGRLQMPPRAGIGGGAGYGGGAYTVEAARAQAASAAVAQQLGDLFEYKIKQPITIPKNRSALVPIVQSAITAEKISVWNEQAALPRPQRALWLINSTGLTLDGGSFSVLDDNAFAGEGVVEPIRPGEKRIVSYALDLGLVASSRIGSEQRRVTHAVIARGTMTHTSEIREKKTYTVRNEDTSPRTVIIEHPVRPGYELRGDIKPVETTAGWMRFRLRVDPKQTVPLVIEEVRPVFATYALSNVTPDQLTMFVQQKSVDKKVEDALRRILDQKAVIADLDARKDAREEEMKEIFDDQQRLRENMKALKGSAEEKALVQRYTRQLDDEENRLEALRKESARLTSESAAAKSTLDKMIAGLSFDIDL